MNSIDWFGVGAIIFAVIAMITSPGRFILGVLAIVGALVMGRPGVFLAGYVLITVFLLIGRLVSTTSVSQSESFEDQLEKQRQQNEKIRYQREQWARWDNYNRGKR